MVKVKLIVAVFLLLIAVCAYAEKDNGYLDEPPIYIDNQRGIPVSLFGSDIPKPGDISPKLDFDVYKSDEFRVNGVNVQPDLDVELNNYILSGFKGFNGGWAGGLSVPVNKTKISGAISGFPASSDITALGDISAFGKKQIWVGEHNDCIVATFGMKFPTGKDNATFNQSNPATTGYFSNSPRQRIPLSWQPGTGSVDGYLGIAYGRGMHRFSYQYQLAAKFNGRGPNNAKVGDVFTASVYGTYGVGKRIAFALGTTLRTQADDDYPNAPIPVNQPPLWGTTSNGTTLYLIPSLRFRIFQKVTVGLEFSCPVIKPDDGFVPERTLSVIFSPGI